MKFLLSTLLVVTVLFDGVYPSKIFVAEQSCDLKTLFDCRQDAVNIVINEGSILLSEGTLRQYCQSLKDSFECVEDYYEECNAPELPRFRNLTSGIQSVLKDICDEESSLREGYSQHVSCYKKTEDYHTCHDTAEETLVERFGEHYRIDQPLANHEDYNMYDCLLAILFKDCLLTNVEERCGKEARTILEEIVNRAGFPIRNKLCPEDRLKVWMDTVLYGFESAVDYYDDEEEEEEE
uniref:U71-Liphistoxin-Lth1a_1 n=1 Tax=Liphistius thaleban TaxID=1905330 RepID=A0A4Q8K265_9ARAC